ncbi:hypothetical protein CC86DRAFT_367773 [Ophiobolus disseminans]|uniref:Uncharacterized protein n=1 Tax=Ophiobolus disseminans TaxID=1469910 RepID=A0A6A7A994_9PLEO|nr:hypothetical protein CC86DRAFT_367773 [Ophiobolus disseminans]
MPLTTPPRPPRPFDTPSAPTFSTAQRSAQARNKPYNLSDKKAAEIDARRYEERIKREQAARILESSEMLIWYSNARNESIPQTRQYFQNIVWGFEEDESGVVWREEWDGEGVGVGSPRSAKGKEKERERGKKRVGSGKYVGV